MPPRCQLLAGNLSLPFRCLRQPPPSYRTFATSQPLAAAKGGDLGSHLPKHVVPKTAPVPRYPYGDSRLFRQADKGLYGGQMIQFGNNVSHRTKTKTRRIWKPNVVSKSFYSVILKKKIKLRVTTSVIKTMEREGGLDEYLLRDNETRVKELGPTGWALRWWLMQTPQVIARMRAEAAALGLAKEVIEENWPAEPAWRTEVKLRQEQLAAEKMGKEEEAEEMKKEEYHKWLRQQSSKLLQRRELLRTLSKREIDAAPSRLAKLKVKVTPDVEAMAARMEKKERMEAARAAEEARETNTELSETAEVGASSDQMRLQALGS
ncbi:hypothetical protein K491DRAFT_698597 [Lophiostoma macrostomum CBS 122681]|uniref:Large ribosomal subunit protein bL28m n=1 Tax=Lophiostoma macrostomum CBS 122681 TaxID=1314788 RepID=A0A6A6SPD3_9PLEO|nr:hypothetical protein K491DRAFT_698597 [Lophiostoma macrostomum CBS 122681]